MANITDPAAVKFSNEQVRPAADKAVQFYWWLKAVQAQYNAAPSLASNLPNDSSVVVDGSAQDGRNQITGADVNAVLTQLAALITSFEANNSAILKVFSKVAVNIH